jgi:hypothetical protein
MNAMMRVGLGFAIGSLPGALAMLANGAFPIWGAAGVLVGAGVFLIGWLRRRRWRMRHGHVHECPGCKAARWCEECPQETATVMFCRECLGRMAPRK